MCIKYLIVFSDGSTVFSNEAIHKSNKRVINLRKDLKSLQKVTKLNYSKSLPKFYNKSLTSTFRKNLFK